MQKNSLLSIIVSEERFLSYVTLNINVNISSFSYHNFVSISLPINIIIQIVAVVVLWFSILNNKCRATCVSLSKVMNF